MNTRRKLLKPRWRKVLADLWEGRARTLLVVASIAVGVFAMGAIATSYLILGQDLNLNYASIHPANIEMATTAFEADFLRTVERIPGIARAEGRRVLSVRASKDGIAWLTLDLRAADDGNIPRINQLQPVAGKTVPGEYELLIAYDSMRETGFHTGDWLKVQLSDGTLRSLRVAGEVGDMTSAYDPLGVQRGYVTQHTLIWLGGTWDYNRLLVTVISGGDDENYIESVADIVEAKVEKSGGTVYHSSVNKSHDYPMADMTLAILGILGVLGGLVALLSASLIVNTLNALFTQQLRQIGVMKLIGAQRRQVLGMYLLMILGYALLALMIAIPLGAWAGYALSKLLAGMLNSSIQAFRLFPQVVGIQVVIALCVPLAAGFLPVRSGSKISVQKAINSDRSGDQPVQLGLLSGLDRLWVRLLSRPGLLSIRNTFRRKGRVLLTLFTLTMGGAIFIAVFNVNSSMETFMDRIMQHFMADITLTFDHPYRAERIIQAALEVPGVEKVEAWSGASAEILDPQDNLIEDLNLIAPPAETVLLQPELLVGRWLRPGDQRALVVSSAIYSLYPHLKPGDPLRLRVAGGRVEDWTVVGVFSFTEMIGGQMGYAEYEYVSDLLGSSGQTASYRLITSSHSLEGQQALTKAVDQHMRSLNLMVQKVEAGLLTRQQVTRTITILIVFLLSMALLTAFVGSIGLAGTMGMNVLERTREIGVMRAIGATDLAIVKSVVTEGVIIGLISWAFAWLASYPISLVLLRIISKAMLSDPLEVTFSPLGVIVWLGAALAFSALASILPARSATHLTIREVLAYE